MYFSIHYPLIDTRIISADKIKIPSPTWPLPNPNGFIRNFGRVRTRRPGAARYWDAESNYCELNKLIKLTDNLDSDHFRVYDSKLHGRFYSDGQFVNKIEIGFNIDTFTSLEFFLKDPAALRSLFEMPLDIKNEKLAVPAYRCGKYLKSAFLKSTTPSKASFTIDQNNVHVGAPIGILLYRFNTPQNLNSGFLNLNIDNENHFLIANKLTLHFTKIDIAGFVGQLYLIGIPEYSFRYPLSYRSKVQKRNSSDIRDYRNLIRRLRKEIYSMEDGQLDKKIIELKGTIAKNRLANPQKSLVFDKLSRSIWDLEFQDGTDKAAKIEALFKTRKIDKSEYYRYQRLVEKLWALKSKKSTLVNKKERLYREIQIYKNSLSYSIKKQVDEAEPSNESETKNLLLSGTETRALISAERLLRILISRIHVEKETLLYMITYLRVTPNLSTHNQAYLKNYLSKISDKMFNDRRYNLTVDDLIACVLSSAEIVNSDSWAYIRTETTFLLTEIFKDNTIKFLKLINMGNITNINGDKNQVIVDSIIRNSLNTIREEHGLDISSAMALLNEKVNASGNADVKESYQTFAEEIQKKEPKKSLVKSLWTGLVALLPAVKDIEQITETLTKFIQDLK